MEYYVIDIEAFMREITIEYGFKMLIVFLIGMAVGFLITKIDR